MQVATFLIFYLEQVNYTMSPKKYLITFDLRNRGLLKILNDSIWIANKFCIIQNLQRSPVLQTSLWSGTFLDTQYDTLALVVSTCSKGLKP